MRPPRARSKDKVATNLLPGRADREAQFVDKVLAKKDIKYF